MGGETEDVGRIAGLVEGSGVLRRAATLHFAGNEAVTQELWSGVDAEAMIGKDAKIAPRLLIEQEPVALDEEDRRIRRDGIGHDVMNAAVIDGECHALLPRRAEFRCKGVDVEGLGCALDGCQGDFFPVTQDGKLQV